MIKSFNKLIGLILLVSSCGFHGGKQSFFEDAHASCFLEVLHDSSNKDMIGYTAILHEAATDTSYRGFLYATNNRIIFASGTIRATIADWSLKIKESVIDTFPSFASPGLLMLDTVLYKRNDTVYAFIHEGEVDNEGCSDCMDVEAYTYFISRRRGVLGYVESIHQDEFNPVKRGFERKRKHIKIFYCNDFEYDMILADTFENNGTYRITPEGIIRL